MKKKIVALCLVLALALTAIGGATLAYFTDVEQTTNTMTVGNVQINLEEVKLVNGKWESLDNSKPINLYPVSWDNREDNNKNVRIYNTSKSGSDAYVRTIIAIPSVLDDVLGLGFARGEAWYVENARVGCDWEKIGSANIGNVKHDIYLCDTEGGKALGANKGYMLSLCSVWMYDTVTNEKLDTLVKTENSGVTLDETTGQINFGVKVLAQGIQTEGFASYDEAMATFGDVLTNVDSWFTNADAAIINDVFGK